MRILRNTPGLAAVAVLILAAGAEAQSLSPEVKTKVDAKVKELRSWSTDPAFVSAVKSHNAGQSADEKAMTNEKWSKLTVLDPFVRAYSKNPLGTVGDISEEQEGRPNRRVLRLGSGRNQGRVPLQNLKLVPCGQRQAPRTDDRQSMGGADCDG